MWVAENHVVRNAKQNATWRLSIHPLPAITTAQQKCPPGHKDGGRPKPACRLNCQPMGPPLTSEHGPSTPRVLTHCPLEDHPARNPGLGRCTGASSRVRAASPNLPSPRAAPRLCRPNRLGDWRTCLRARPTNDHPEYAPARPPRGESGRNGRRIAWEGLPCPPRQTAKPKHVDARDEHRHPPSSRIGMTQDDRIPHLHPVHPRGLTLTRNGTRANILSCIIRSVDTNTLLAQDI